MESLRVDVSIRSRGLSTAMTRSEQTHLAFASFSTRRSRQWGVVEQYRLGRIMWRRFADYNQMSGVMRSTFDRYTRQNTEMMSRERRIIREDP